MLSLDEIVRIITVLNDAGVRYVLIGGVAMRLHGCAHLTDDLDICYARDLDNLTTLAGALSPHKPRLRGVPEDLPFSLGRPNTQIRSELHTDNNSGKFRHVG